MKTEEIKLSKIVLRGLKGETKITISQSLFILGNLLFVRN